MTTAITANKKGGSFFTTSLFSPFRFSGCPPPPASQVATVVSCEPDVRHLLLAAAAAVGPSDGVHFLSKGTAANAVSAATASDVDEDDERIVIEDDDDQDGAEIQSKASIR